ncbi:hypothetical protein P5G51_015850 [Virgibacillus sp. 179-BFC.A HS]|uniref:Aspartate phosphatase n=1 Tax=Tigheibacillus jepli TaxID=3035914 RepID=A0ABU5CJT9_9BACI|nr:hypothetical protein [Virgibacillus sp. 179-BFC.A HS]MDY0406637.1 hypothetical protein [Virgibacillus sp. 179-BFC.A HS]
MIDKALLLYDESMQQSGAHYQLFYYIINTYQYLINKEYENFESLVADEFIPYLKEQKDYGNLVIYAEMLGEHFEHLGKYKESVKYYKLASRTYEQIVNL